jgi:hypothetical protein
MLTYHRTDSLGFSCQAVQSPRLINFEAQIASGSESTDFSSQRAVSPQLFLLCFSLISKKLQSKVAGSTLYEGHFFILS